MKHSFFAVSGLFILTLCTLLSTGCKEDTIIKANLAPGDNSFGTESVGDTMTVITKTVFIKSLKTSDKISGIPVVQALGTMVDPFFGITNASIYFQVLPTITQFNFPDGSTIDSAVLILPYLVSWGDRTNPKPQKFQVYRVTEDMTVGTDYYSDHSKQTGDMLGEITIDLAKSLKDTPKIGDKSTGYIHLRIPLSTDFINEVRNNMAALDGDDKFLQHFKGFYVTPDTTVNIANNTNQLPYVIYEGGNDYSRLAIAFYYRESGSNETKTAFFNYNREKNAHFNRITRRYTGFPAQSFIDRYNTTINTSDDTIILQNEPGAAIDIRILHIDKLPTSAIIKAELVITKISTGDAADSLLTPSRLTIEGIDENGAEYVIKDFTTTDINAAVEFVDGAKRTEKDANNNEITLYRINIPREVQRAIIDKRNELHLRIRGSRIYPAAYRFVAGGRNHPTYRTQLNIVYSKPN